MIRRIRYYMAVVPAIIGVTLIHLAIMLAEPIDRHVFRGILRWVSGGGLRES